MDVKYPDEKTLLRQWGHCDICGKPLTADRQCSAPESCGKCTACGQPYDECNCPAEFDWLYD